MKKITILFALIAAASICFAQYNKIDTSFYSVSLQETKMVDVYFPPGYDENPDLYYPVIYYLHAWLADQNLMGSEMLSITQSMINSGSISPVIMVCADNSPDPFGGSMYANSILWGNYEDYMITDLINWIENSFRAMPSKNYRALLGHSMGGYGAFRYGTLHKDKFRVLAATASAIINLTDDYQEYSRQKIMTQNPGPPFTYDYYTTGFSTKGLFLFCGAFSPNLNSPQTYINPQIVEFAMDSNGYWIDTIVDKMRTNSIDHLIHQLSPEDSIGILFGCGSADVSIYPSHIAFKDTLDLLGLPYEFYNHTGGHIMPYGFKQRALIFIDSLMAEPYMPSNSCLPEGITFTTQEQIDNFQNNYPNCTEIEGNVDISGSNITNLNGLNVVTSIGGYLNIINNPALSSLTGLEGLTSIGYFFNISGNDELTSLTGLEGLTSIGTSFHIEYSDALTSLIGLDNLTSIGGWLFIQNNDALTSLMGMETLTSIGYNFNISDNDALTSLTGLEGLTSIGYFFEIFNNDALTSLAGLNNLTSIGSHFAILQNYALTSLTGLEGLTSIGGDLSIQGSNALTRLTGLESLTSIGGTLEIVGNNNLTSLTGMEGLTSIGWGISIGDNPALTSLTGLENIDAGLITDLAIKYNPSLSSCEVQSICDYLAVPNATIQIYNNAPGCNSLEEVQEACDALSIEDPDASGLFTISPIPFSQYAVIEFDLPHTAHVSAQIFNALGAKVADLHHGLLPAGQRQIGWDSGSLPKGLYICRVQVGQEIVSRKILKL